MQVSAITDDYSQVTRALDLNRVVDNTHNDSNKSSWNTSANKNTEKDNINSAIQEWKNFCHQQILKGKLDIIA